MHSITLFRAENGLMAKHSDPEVYSLFGTDVIPTAFTAEADPETVVDEIRRLNPHCRVGCVYPSDCPCIRSR